MRKWETLFYITLVKRSIFAKWGTGRESGPIPGFGWEFILHPFETLGRRGFAGDGVSHFQHPGLCPPARSRESQSRRDGGAGLGLSAGAWPPLYAASHLAILPPALAPDLASPARRPLAPLDAGMRAADTSPVAEKEATRV
jgi:hypothetical protein